MKPPPFDHLAPETLSGALAALAEHGDDAKLIAGGQSLMPMLALRLARPGVLIDLNRVEGLDRVLRDGDVLTVGAMTRHRGIERLPWLRERCPLIADAVALIGHPAIRNRGTVGGSLAHADPAAEWPAVALALDAELELTGREGARIVAARDFFLTFLTTAIAPDEVLTEVRFRLPRPRSGSCFTEMARRHGDFALVGVGAVVELDEHNRVGDCRLAVIGGGTCAIRMDEAEQVLRGEPLSDALIAEAGRAVGRDVSPLGDVHATADDRRHLADVLTRRTLATAVARIPGGGRNGHA